MNTQQSSTIRRLATGLLLGTCLTPLATWAGTPGADGTPGAPGANDSEFDFGLGGDGNPAGNGQVGTGTSAAGGNGGIGGAGGDGSSTGEGFSIAIGGGGGAGGNGAAGTTGDTAGGATYINNATLAGHVEVGDYVIVGGLSAVHQFVRIGPYAMIGGMSGVEYDVIPFGLVKGERAHLAGLNYIGLERRGFTKEQVQSLMKAFKQIFDGTGTLSERTAKAANDYKDEQAVMRIVDFMRAKEGRSVLQPKA